MVVADGGGERPPRAAKPDPSVGQPERLARDLGGVLAHGERALVERSLEGEQSDEQGAHAALSSTRVAMRS